jgi:hypothetical protein
MKNEEFENWLNQDVADAVTVRDVISKYSDPLEAAYAGFAQRQPEIDALGDQLIEEVKEKLVLDNRVRELKAEVERLRKDAARYQYILECDVISARKYVPNLNADEYMAKRRAAHDAAMKETK